MEDGRMRDDGYGLAGRVRISENKKEEFSGYILRILDLGGIRKTEQMKLGGQILMVVGQPQN